MKPMFDSDDVKGSFFLATLPDTMDNVIDNLSTRAITAFKDIEPKILDISEKHSLDVDSAAYIARSAGRQPASRQPQRQECTWCRKHQLTYIGHVYNNCNELRRYQEQQKEKKKTPTGNRTGGKRHKGNSANATDPADGDSDSGYEVTGFTTNGKRIRDNDVSAYAAIRLPSALDPPVWLFDTGASRHMSGCADDFISLLPKTMGTITVAGGIKLPIQGTGTVRIRLRLPDDSTTIAELTNVLYSSELYNTRLFSWSYVRQHGYELRALRDDLYLSRNGKYALWAKHTKGSLRTEYQFPGHCWPVHQGPRFSRPTNR
ncbi:hypothetical protein K458DRAFT_439359 [Lentithecium fluviatile CBS 122367]|uniref:Retrovirus-related Pol polyprotein from transposon TNT 1-94-like beta-barrel domain-containing protein n=1 Tax=Lentithecium fluviatile CBS 122367 TaxID=1168545 RepID=A0A6G1JIJ0_9PLEO|nr:hypothetical protein K458DRAFT_439359 [Lentithecium fluviatile CBS 122367]